MAASTCVESVRWRPCALSQPRVLAWVSRASKRRCSAPPASTRERNSLSTELGRPLARYRELPCSIGPPPNEVGYRRGTRRSSHGPFSLPPSQTGLDPFGVIRLSSPCFRNDAVDVPA